MNCPQKNHNCSQIFFAKLYNKGHYICCGLNSKPSKYKKDNIWLCLSGTYCKDISTEMTLWEALNMSCALVSASEMVLGEELSARKEYLEGRKKVVKKKSKKKVTKKVKKNAKKKR